MVVMLTSCTTVGLFSLHVVAQEPLPTANMEWGYFGTLVRGGFQEEMATRAFESVSHSLIDAGLSPEEARDALDSILGRHLADELVSQLYRSMESIVAGASVAPWFAKEFQKQRRRR